MKNFEILDFNVLSDDRGWMIQPISNEQLISGKIKNVHVASLGPGVVRGNHYHLARTEYALILGGSCEVSTINNATMEVESLILREDKPVVLKIPPSVSHAFKNIGEKAIYLVCYSDKTFDPRNPDTVESKILA